MNVQKASPDKTKYWFLWGSLLSLVSAIGFVKLNSYLGTQVNYLDYLTFFNLLTLVTLWCAFLAILLSIAGVWKSNFKSIPLVLMSLVSSAFLFLLFAID